MKKNKFSFFQVLIVCVILVLSLQPASITSKTHSSDLTSRSDNEIQIDQNIVLNDTTRSHSEIMSPYINEAWASYLVFVNVSASIDVNLTLNIDTTDGELIGFSNEEGMGSDEYYIIQPYSLTNLQGKDVMLSVTQIMGEGSITIEVSEVTTDNVVPQTDKLGDFENFEVDDYTLIPLNYSLGSYLSIEMENLLSNRPMNLDMYIFTSNGNLSSNIYNTSIQDSNFQSTNIDLPLFLDGEIDGLNLLIINKGTEAHEIQVRSKYSLPTNIVQLEDGVTNATVTKSNPLYYAFGTNFEVTNIFINSYGQSYSYTISKNPFFNDTSLYYHSNNTSNYIINEIGDSFSNSPIGYSFYFLKINSSEDITVSVSFERSYFGRYVSDTTTLSGTASDTEFYSEIITTNFYPSETLIWVEPLGDVDLKLAVGRQTGDTLSYNWKNEKGMGEIETVGNIDTSSSELIIVSVTSVNGSGSFYLHIARGGDQTNPNVDTVELSATTVNQSETFEVSITSSDDVQVYREVIEYREVGSTDDWSELLPLANGSYTLPYGLWDLRVIAIDVGMNSYISTNNSNYYRIQVLDNLNPVLHSFNASFIPDEKTSVYLNFSDSLSGMKSVIVEYSNSTYTGNITEYTYENHIYQLVIPAQTVGEFIHVKIYASDKSGNWYSSLTYQFYVNRTYFDFSNLTFDNTTEIDTVFKVRFDILSNDVVEEIELQYTYNQCDCNFTVDNFQFLGNSTYEISVEVNMTGELIYSILIKTITGYEYLTGQYSVVVIDPITTSQSTTTSTTASISSISSTVSNNSVMTNTTNGGEDNNSIWIFIGAGGGISLIVSTLYIRVKGRPKFFNFGGNN